MVKHARLVKVVAALVLGLALAGPQAPAHAALCSGCTYVAYDIGVLPGSSGNSSVGTAITDTNGGVVGGSGSDPTKAFSWRADSGLVELAPPTPGAAAFASAIDGYAVGSCSAAAGSGIDRACRFELNGAAVSLGTLAGTASAESSATGIDGANGMIVGFSTAASGPADFHAFYYYAGTMHDAHGYVAPPGSDSQFNAINRLQHAIGYYSPVSGSARGFLWKFGPSAIDLGTLGGSGAPGTIPWGMNHADQVTGQAVTASGETRAFRWSEAGGMTNLGTLAGYAGSVGYGINGTGEVVGFAYNPFPNFSLRGFLHSGGVIRDLTALLPPGSGITIVQGRDINDQGQITGSALFPGQSQPHAMFMTICGNGVHEGGAEECDQGVGVNGTAGSCCTQYCRHTTVGTECRAADASGCDVAETCSGTSATCPANGFRPNGSTCVDDGLACTLDRCNATGTCTHPAGNVGLVCRPAAGDCDVAETCAGATSCPSDGYRPSGTCTDDGNPCTQDVCTGSGTACSHPAGNAGAACSDEGNPCTLDQCNGASALCQHPAGNAGSSCPDEGNPCTLDRCDGTTPTCQHPPNNGASCNDGNACTASDTCQSGTCQGGGAVNCLDSGPNAPCTTDTCHPGTGCQHTGIPNCDASRSAEAQCSPATTCTITSPTADVTIPAGCLPQATTVNIAALSAGTCPQYFDLHGLNTNQLVSCTELVSPTQSFNCPITVALKWTNTGNTCDVDSAGGTIREGRIRVLRNGAAIAPAAASGCGTSSPSSLQCPTEAALAYPCSYAPDPTFCAAGSSAVCNPTANRWTFQALHFSEYALANVCSDTGAARLKVAHPFVPNKGALSFRGLLLPPDGTVPDIDPAANGVELTLVVGKIPALEVAIPGGPAWKVGRTGSTWTYRNTAANAPGGIKSIVVNLAAAKPKFKVTGNKGTYDVGTDLSAELYFPVSDVCFAARFGVERCVAKATSIQCK